MALTTTPTLAICLTAAVAAGIGLARPADRTIEVVASPAAGEPAPAAEAPATDDPYGAQTGEPAPEPTPVAEAEVPAGAPAAVAVSIADFDFAGATEVAAGGAIEVTNLDGVPHTLTADSGAFDTGDLGNGESAVLVAPTAPGTYSFFCAIHPSMTGSIVVS